MFSFLFLIFLRFKQLSQFSFQSRTLVKHFQAQAKPVWNVVKIDRLKPRPNHEMWLTLIDNTVSFNIYLLFICGNTWPRQILLPRHSIFIAWIYHQILGIFLIFNFWSGLKFVKVVKDKSNFSQLSKLIKSIISSKRRK